MHGAVKRRLSKTPPGSILALVAVLATPDPSAVMLTGVFMQLVTDGIMVAVIALGVARRRAGYDSRRTEHHRKR
jgi:hypothetical protein